MEKKERLINKLTQNEIKEVVGGYRAPTEKELERIREKYGPLGEIIICW